MPTGKGDGALHQLLCPQACTCKSWGSPGPAAGAGPAAAQGSAESPAACSGTEAGLAEIPRWGSLLLAGERVWSDTTLGSQKYGGWDESGVTTAGTHLPITHLLLWMAALKLGSPGQNRVLALGLQEFPVRCPFSSKHRLPTAAPPAYSALVGDTGGSALPLPGPPHRSLVPAPAGVLSLARTLTQRFWGQILTTLQSTPSPMLP